MNRPPIIARKKWWGGVLVLLAGACTPTQYGAAGGVNSLPAMPGASCIEEALRAIPGVEFIAYSSATSPMLSLGGGAVTSRTHHWTYRDGGFLGNLSFDQIDGAEGDVAFSHSLSRSRAKLTDRERAQTAARLADLNNRIGDVCGVALSRANQSITTR